MCTKGKLIALAQRTQQHSGAGCKSGYQLRTASPLQTAGVGWHVHNGELIALAHTHASAPLWKCNYGYQLHSGQCPPPVARSGVGMCNNGKLIAPAQRTQQFHCGSCSSGYQLRGRQPPSRVPGVGWHLQQWWPHRTGAQHAAASWW